MYTRALLKNKICFSDALVLCCVVGTFSCEIGLGTLIECIDGDEFEMIESCEYEENFMWMFSLKMFEAL